MARKKAAGRILELVWWKDAESEIREPINPTLPRFFTVGFVVQDDDEVVILSHEFPEGEAKHDAAQDWTKIPKALVLGRFVVWRGEIAPALFKRPENRPAAGGPSASVPPPTSGPDRIDHSL